MSAQQIESLLYELGRQYPTSVSTFSPCQCGRAMRGAGPCSACLIEKLIEAGMAPETVRQYVELCSNRAHASAAVDEATAYILATLERVA